MKTTVLIARFIKSGELEQRKQEIKSNKLADCLVDDTDYASSHRRHPVDPQSSSTSAGWQPAGRSKWTGAPWLLSIRLPRHVL